MNQVLSATSCAIQWGDLCGPLVATLCHCYLWHWLFSCWLFGGSGLVVGCDRSFVRTWLCCIICAQDRKKKKNVSAITKELKTWLAQCQHFKSVIDKDLKWNRQDKNKYCWPMAKVANHSVPKLAYIYKSRGLFRLGNTDLNMFL